MRWGVWTRRCAPWLLAALALSFGSCAGANNVAEGPPGSCTHTYGPAGTQIVAFDDPGKADNRRSCLYQQGARTTDTIGDKAPLPTPIKHVIVLMLENRSFDHYLSDLPAVGVTGADVAGNQSNPDGNGGSAARYHETQYCIGGGTSPPHDWSDAHLALAAGKLDGFAQAGGCGAMSYYTHDDLPVTYALAQAFATSDRYFSPLLGPTWPNRFFFFLATSCNYAEGADSNVDTILKCGAFQPSIFGLLDGNGHTYDVYDESSVGSVAVASGIYKGVPKSIAQFETDVGNLREVTIVGASTGGLPSPPFATEDDAHPPSDVRLAEQFIHRIVTALVNAPATWASSVLFVTFDEYGGFYDHVEPPHACDPLLPPLPPLSVTDAGAPSIIDGLNPDPKRDYYFDQYGFRVPLLIVSPYAKPGYVSHMDADHTSILRFIEHWLGLPALTSRDANAWPLLDAFDFTRAPTTPTIPSPPTFTACTGAKPSCAP